MKRVKEIIHYQSKNMPERRWMGEKIVVAVLDTGVMLHPELMGRILIFRDFVNEFPDIYDDNGHGTHVCGVIAGRQIGIAPECRLIVLKVLDQKGNGKIEHCMRGFRWILENQEKYNIRIVNISMGMEPHKNVRGEHYILNAVEVLWDMGITVVAAAGNLGPADGSITIPGVSRKIITVGSSDDQYFVDEYGKRRKSYSGRGSLKKNMLKPDLLVPGSRIFSCNAHYGEKGEKLYVAKSGTSMSTPIVTGAAADLLSKYPNLTNEEVKRRLKGSCEDLGMEVTRQGSGMLNFQKLMR